ncbi:MAG TPA: hypothetical protein VFU43_02540 [Streptosporangiaceae bacterium]|nr:hypothetical protein [Streptosporangiaceae bacterium]
MGALLMLTVLAVPVQYASAAPCRPALAALTVPGLMHAGDTASGSVTLDCVPRADVEVSLRSDPSSLSLPATVTVRRGQTVAAFPMTASLVDGPWYVAHITADYKRQSLTQDVNVSPGLKSVEIPPSTAPNDVVLRILLTGPAPSSGLTVLVASDSPAVTVPTAINIPPGAMGLTTGTGFEDSPVTQDTTVNISITLGTRTLTASKVLIPPFDGSQRISIQSGGAVVLYGQSFAGFTVLLDNPAPAGGIEAQVSVVDDNPAVQLESPSVFISEDQVVGGFFFNTADVTSTTHVTFKVTALQATAFLDITIQPRITAVTLPTSAQSGTSFEGTVTLAGPSDVDTVVSLQTSMGILDVPGTLTIPAGATSATFQATSAHVDQPTTAFVNAFLGGAFIQSNGVTLMP